MGVGRRAASRNTQFNLPSILRAGIADRPSWAVHIYEPTIDDTGLPCIEVQVYADS